MIYSTDMLSLFPGQVDMPEGIRLIYRQEKEPEPFCLTLVDLVQLERKVDQLAAMYLSPAEQEIFSGYTYVKRRKEWLGGRLAAKMAAAVLIQTDLESNQLSRFSILARQDGSPSITDAVPARRQPLSVSISHSATLAVSMVTTVPSCGVDIQRISEQTERVADRFCTTPEELILKEELPGRTAKELLTMLWAAKEALKKSLLKNQPTIFKGVTLRSISSRDTIFMQLDYPNGLTGPAAIAAHRLDEYILAYTVAESHHA